MNILPPLDVPAILRQYGLHPDHSLGQNFLVDEAGLLKVLSAAQIAPGEDVLEIGSGLGNLTRLLAQVARRVIAVEIDPRLITPLEAGLHDFINVQIIRGDILELNPAELMQARPYVVVANIPYYITSAILRHLLETHPQPIRLILTVQREVAERICAESGKMSLLALSVQVYGQPKITARIPAGAFYPPPKVDSSVIRVELYPESCIPETSLPLFFRLAKAGFSQKRKTLRNALAAGMAWSKDHSASVLQAAGIDPIRRAETLSMGEWKSLTQAAQQTGPS